MHCLPSGDHDLPSTGVPGVNRDAILRLLAPPSVRNVGAVVPITVDLDLSSNEYKTSGIYCIRLSAEPGAIEFPLGDTCDTGMGASPAGTGGEGGAPAKSSVQSCVSPVPQAGGRLDGIELAAYTPTPDEKRATIFGAAYEALDCSGAPIAKTFTVLHFTAENGEGGESGQGGMPNPGSGALGGGPSGGMSAGGTSGTSSGSGGAGQAGGN
jgi:hypothetical protein